MSLYYTWGTQMFHELFTQGIWDAIIIIIIIISGL